MKKEAPVKITQKSPKTSVPTSKPQVHAAAPKASVVASYDLDKLAKAIALHETGDCTAKVGSALYHNCHGFRVSNHFLHFQTKAESYAKFKKLWTSDYKEFPNLRLATAYVCGWNHLKKNGPVPCSGGNPQSWLTSVVSAYDRL